MARTQMYDTMNHNQQTAVNALTSSICRGQRDQGKALLPLDELPRYCSQKGKLRD